MSTTIQLPQPVREVRLVDATAAPVAPAITEDARAAYDRGRSDAEKALNELMLQQRLELGELQKGVLQSLRQSAQKVVRDSEDALVALAIEVAQKLVAGLPVSAEMVGSAVREALAQVEETSEFIVCLHPEDLALLQRINSPMVSSEGAGKQMRFQASNEVTRGGCLVRTRFGVIDGRRETKIELLKQTLQP
jgi:flagellar assembly protein FliH